MERRVALTDFQKIIVYIGIVVAVGGVAWTLGQWHVLPLLVGTGTLVAVVIGAYTIQVRRASAGTLVVSAVVLSVSAAPANAEVAAPCTLRVEMRLPGR